VEKMHMKKASDGFIFRIQFRLAMTRQLITGSGAVNHR